MTVDEEDARNAARLMELAASWPEPRLVWVMPSMPFIVYIAIGFSLIPLVGDIPMGLVNLIFTWF